MGLKLNADVNTLPLWVWFILALALLTQSILIYRDAEKRGENKWLWGLFGLLNVPSSGLIYYVISRKVWRRHKED